MENPTKVKIGNKYYKINSDFRVAIECDAISRDESIGDYERALAIIYKLFGEEALEDLVNQDKLLELAKKFLLCGQNQVDEDKEPDMDFIQDEGAIKSSFKYDYKYNPYEMKYLHWWDFYNDLCNLSNSELGNCCALSNIRNLRNYDVSQIKDLKERNKIIEAKKRVSLIKEKKPLSKEKQDSVNKFYELAGIERRD